MSKLCNEVNILLKEIKSGKSGSFKKLYDTTFNYLKVVAFNYLSDYSNIEDVLNESYFRIFKYISNSCGEKDGYNWMCKIVQNKAYDYNKKNGVFLPINKVVEDGLFNDIEDNILDKCQLFQIIKTFSKREQELLYLRFWEDLSFESISKRTSIPKSSVVKIINRKLKEIEKFIKKS